MDGYTAIDPIVPMLKTMAFGSLIFLIAFAFYILVRHKIRRVKDGSI